MARVAVLGCGLVGSVLAADLAGSRQLRVSVFDVRPDAMARAPRGVRALKSRCAFHTADLSDVATIRRIAAASDLVVGALPSRFGWQTLRTVVETGTNYVDISFLPEDFLELNRLAKRRGLLAVCDCGVAPGLSNMLAADAARRLRPCREIDIMVGGLPVERRWPFNYKAPFSPHDVLEEYVRPSRVVEGGRVVIREALSGAELVELPGVGTVEAFFTDGLRSLAQTLRVPTMRERTLRYPGHAELMRVLRQIGLFSQEPVSVGGALVEPRALTASLLFPQWKYEEGERDLTVMRVAAEGTLRRRSVRIVWDLLDFHDRRSGFPSMSRTTAFPAASLARQILTGKLSGAGVLAPEQAIQQPGVLSRVLRDLADRGVRLVPTIHGAGRTKQTPN